MAFAGTQIRGVFADAWTYRSSFTFADVLYVSLARHLGASLLTDDTRLVNARSFQFLRCIWNVDDACCLLLADIVLDCERAIRARNFGQARLVGVRRNGHSTGLS